MKAVAVAAITRLLREAVDSISDRIATKFFDLEAQVGAREVCEVAALALAHDFNLIDVPADPDAHRNRERCRQRTSLAPRPRAAVGDVKQQCCKRQLRCPGAGRHKLVAVLCDESR